MHPSDVQRQPADDCETGGGVALAIEYDMAKYARRHLVENFFCRIKGFRRFATHYNQTESGYAAMICMAAVVLALA